MLFKKPQENQRLDWPSALRGVDMADVQIAPLAAAETLVVVDPGVFFEKIPVLQHAMALSDQTEDSRRLALQVAASIMPAGHTAPVRSAFVTGARELGIPIREIEAEILPSGAVLGKLDRTWYIFGNSDQITAEGFEVGVAANALHEQWELQGGQVYYLAQKQPKRLLGMFALRHPLLADMETCLEAWRRQGLRQIVLIPEEDRASCQALLSTIGDWETYVKRGDGIKQVKKLLQEHPNSLVAVRNPLKDADLPELSLTVRVGPKRRADHEVAIPAWSALPALLEQCRQHRRTPRRLVWWKRTG